VERILQGSCDVSDEAGSDHDEKKHDDKSGEAVQDVKLRIDLAAKIQR